MSNRYLKDSIWTSPNFNKLSVYGERHFSRILLKTDDWGCLEITPQVIKGGCYPLKKDVEADTIESWNTELVEHNILKVWEENGRVYAMFVTFDSHNEALEKHDPKTPCPPWLLVNGTDPRLSNKTSDAFQRITEAIKELSSNGHKPNFNEIATKANSSKSTIVKYFRKLKAHGTSGTVGGTGGTNGGTDA